MTTRGVIMFNRGPKMVLRALVALYSLRKYYNGDITFYIEEPTPPELDDALKSFNCNIVHNEVRHDLKTLVRKSSLLEDPPYDLTLWMDLDTVTVGPIDAMFDYLIDKQVDVCFPSFCNWVSTGHHISSRIKRFIGIAEDRHIKEALNNHPSVNTGVLSFKRSDKWKKFMGDVTELARKGSEQHIFIPDEVAMSILYPSMGEWGLKSYICETDYNVSPIHDHGISKSPKIIHAHGDKHVLDVKGCDPWKSTFKEMCDKNIANINAFLKYADKRLGLYLKSINDPNYIDTTIVTACDAYYVDILQHTFANWRKYKGIDKHPVIVFVHGLDIKTDPKLEFLRLPNVTMIPWKMENAENHREEMLSAFVFGSAEHVKTEYWLKLDADSYATDDRPFILEKMKKFAFCGHKWGYSRPYHIQALDTWAKGHWKRKLRKAAPMITEGKVEGNRFYHNSKRTISFIQLHKARFTRFCVGLIRPDEKTGLKRLPAPTQDTFMFYVANRFDPDTVGIMNFKRECGFTQGRGKMGADHIKKCVEAVDQNIASKIINSETEDEGEP
jgi:hypothetical protein